MRENPTFFAPTLYPELVAPAITGGTFADLFGHYWIVQKKIGR